MMWEKLLAQRSNMRASDAIDLLKADEYTIDDVRQQRPISDYVQQVARHSRTDGFKDEWQQVLRGFSYLAPSLQRDIHEPTETTALLSLIQKLEAKKTAWGRLYALKLPENYQQSQRQQNWAQSYQNT